MVLSMVLPGELLCADVSSVLLLLSEKYGHVCCACRPTVNAAQLPSKSL